MLSDPALTQGRLWGAGASDWVAIQEPMSVPLWNAVLDFLGPCDSLLDAGCGAGGAAMQALLRGIPVECFDPSAEFVELAKARGLDVKLGELESIPYGNGEFACAMANNSLQFTADATAGLFELKRVTRERIAIVVWGPEEANEIRRVFEAVVALFPKRPSGRGAFALSTAGLLERHVKEAGLRILRERLFDGVFEYPSIEVAVRGQMSAGPTRRAVEILGEAQVRAAVEQVFQSGCALKYEFRIVVVGA